VVPESPTVARRQLRQALRRAREAKALTQGQVADALEWSLSKVNRIESGDVTVSNTDLRALLALLEVRAADEVNRLVETGRVARRREESLPHVTPAMRQFLEYEREALVIRSFQPTLVSGLFQTPEYAASILGFWREVLPDEVRDARVRLRLQRRKDVLERERPLTYQLVLDESVFHRRVGSGDITARQFEALAAMARAGQLDVRMLPFSDGSSLSIVGAFSIVDLPGEENAVMYTEATRSDNLVQDHDELVLHRRIFDLMWERSLSHDDSIEFIEKAGNRLHKA
jgi:transcriptional regulator with XRE-family HTH domain